MRSSNCLIGCAIVLWAFKADVRKRLPCVTVAYQHDLTKCIERAREAEIQGDVAMPLCPCLSINTLTRMHDLPSLIHAHKHVRAHIHIHTHLHVP